MAKVTVNKDAGASAAPAASTGPKTASVTDSLGRAFVVKRPGPLDQMRMFGIVGAQLSQNDRYMGYAVLAFAIVSMSGEANYRQPANIAELEALVGRLGEEGMEAIAEGLSAIAPRATTEEVVETAKN